jgi:hypothetical protein
MGFPQRYMAGAHTPRINDPASKGCTYDPQLKMNQTGWRTTSPLLHPLIMCGLAGFRHLAALSIHPGRRPELLYARGLLDTTKYCSSRVSGSIALKHRPRWDVALGSHASLAPGARVGSIPSPLDATSPREHT